MNFDAAEMTRTSEEGATVRIDIVEEKVREVQEQLYGLLDRVVDRAVRAGWRGNVYAWVEWRGTRGRVVAGLVPPAPGGARVTGPYVVDLSDEAACARWVLEGDALSEMREAERTLGPGG